MRGPRSTAVFLAPCVGFLALADIAPVGSTAVVYLITWGLLTPKAIPALLVLAASVQDATGFSNRWSYIAFLVLGCVFLVKNVIGRTLSGSLVLSTPGTKRLVTVAALGAGTVAYGVSVSLINDILGGPDQDPGRPAAAIGALMMLMLLTGVLASLRANRDVHLRRRVVVAAWLGLANILLVTAAQIALGPFTGHSEFGVTVIRSATQLTESSALGIPRLTGTLVHPNSLPLFATLLAMVAIIMRPGGRPPWGLGIVVLVAGGVAGVLALSKAGIALAVMTAAVFFWVRWGWRSAIGPLVLGGCLVLANVNWSTWGAALRFGWGSDSYRDQAWRAVLSDLTVRDWIFGTGLAHWPVFFQRRLGVALIDPHNVVLSVSGTFGLVGLGFYGFLLVSLLRVALTTRTDSSRIAALFLAGLLFGKDLVTVPSLLSNTTSSYLVWLILGTSLLSAAARPRAPSYHGSTSRIGCQTGPLGQRGA